MLSSRVFLFHVTVLRCFAGSIKGSIVRVIVGFALAHYGGGILCDKNQYNLND